jgi:hypothetical protein
MGKMVSLRHAMTTPTWLGEWYQEDWDELSKDRSIDWRKDALLALIEQLGEALQELSVHLECECDIGNSSCAHYVAGSALAAYREGLK